MSTLYVDTLEPNQNTAIDVAAGKLLPVGHVVQVVSASTTTNVAVATTSWTDTTLSASITPTSSNSKILIVLTQHVYNSRYGGSLRILRNATSIYEPSAIYAIYNDTGAATGIRQYATLNYLDAPSSTSLLTYKTQFAHYTGGSTTYLQASGYFQSDITLMEIAQ